MESQFTINENMTARYEKTFRFIKKHIPNAQNVLDLGVTNPFSDLLKEHGYNVFNTRGEDLDLQPEVVKQFGSIEFATALEICEHLINPMGVLSSLPCEKLVASVPLSLWFAKAYRSKTTLGIVISTNSKTGNLIGYLKNRDGKSKLRKNGMDQ